MVLMVTFFPSPLRCSACHWIFPQFHGTLAVVKGCSCSGLTKCWVFKWIWRGEKSPPNFPSKPTRGNETFNAEIGLYALVPFYIFIWRIYTPPFLLKSNSRHVFHLQKPWAMMEQITGSLFRNFLNMFVGVPGIHIMSVLEMEPPWTLGHACVDTSCHGYCSTCVPSRPSWMQFCEWFHMDIIFVCHCTVPMTKLA